MWCGSPVTQEFLNDGEERKYISVLTFVIHSYWHSKCIHVPMKILCNILYCVTKIIRKAFKTNIVGILSLVGILVLVWVFSKFEY